MPPIEPPAMENSEAIPRWSSSMACARTMSRMVMTGKSRPQGLPVLGLVEAGAEHVRANDEIAFGVDRPAGADHGFPPARLLRHRMEVGDVLVAGQGVADQHRVAALGIERTIGLVTNLEWSKIDTGVER